MGTPESAEALPATIDTPRDREGRDEMNLAEYPIALLADRAPNGLKTLIYHDKDETLTITGSDLLGLPTALDVDVIIGLLHLTKVRSNFQSSQVSFTRYELIRLLGWPDRGFYYARLTESLNRWVGVTLLYKKSWWDNETKTKGNHTFHILESATVIEQEQRRGCQAQQIPLPLSSVRWSREFFKSFQANNLKKLDLGMYFSLKSAISKQLYRFLDKRFYKRAECSFDLRTLACEHVGMSRNSECWRLKQKLQPAIDELTSAGFLKPMPADKRFKRVGAGQWTVTFVRAKQSEQEAVEAPRDEAILEPEPNELEVELGTRGVAPKVARELVGTFPESRIRIQIEQVDWLRKKGKRKIADLGGFLTQAIRDDYARPEGFVSSAERAERQRAQNERRQQEIAEARRKQEATRRLEADRAQVREFWDKLSPAQKMALDDEVLASEGPDQAKLYREMLANKAPFAEAMVRLVRERYIRQQLGLPAEESST